MKYIAVLGGEEDYHACHMKEALEKKGHAACMIDLSHFPKQLNVSWDPEVENGWIHGVTDHIIGFSDISAVYWRTLKLPDFSALANRDEWIIAQNDGMSLLKTFLSEPNIRWVNNYNAYLFHQMKPRQLSLAHKMGARIPPTVITNQADQVLAFVKKWDSVIFKPVQGGAHTEKVTPDLLEKKRLEMVLALCPVTLQQYIAGTNIRTYVLGNKVYSAEIDSSSVDFRTDVNAKVLAIDTPPEVALLSRKINQAFGMVWTAIDWRRDEKGHYYFLEANPSPMFYHFEQCTGYPITENLVDLLSVEQ